MMLTSRRDLPLLIKELIIKGITLNYFVVRKIINEELNLEKNIKVLDIGSGTGTLSPIFANCDYVGIDINERLVNFSKKIHPFLFKTMDAQKLDFPDNFFDAVLISGVIHHLNDKESEKVLKGIKRVLRKKGLALFIEAISPIDKYNFLGHLLRNMDEGHNIRKLGEYENIFKKFLNVKKSYEKRGGLIDYGVFVLSK